MTTVLRLGSRDRSSSSFKRANHPGSEGSTVVAGSKPLDGGLPTIAHVDTRSFVNLFDRYQSAETGEAERMDQYQPSSPHAKDFAWPVASPLHSTPVMPDTQSTSRVTALERAEDGELCAGLVMRNDSTGSSSVAMSRRSDDSPPMTRNSSASSIAHPGSPSLTKAISADNNESRPRRSNGDDYPKKTTSRSCSWTSANARTSPRLDLDKPLPPLRNRPPIPLQYPAFRRHVRSVSLPLPTAFVDRHTAPAIPYVSSSTTRGAKLGMAMATATTRARSTSAIGKSTAESRGSSTIANDCLDDIVLPIPGIPQQTHKRSKPISPRTSERVLYRILSHLDDVKDLQSAALVSKSFFQTFMNNESNLVSRLIFDISKPAWELRRSILILCDSRTFRLKDYIRDLRTLAALKKFIVGKCVTRLKKSTTLGLSGSDQLCQTQVDNALWRIWTFCALFGDNAASSRLRQSEVDWLKGSTGISKKYFGTGFAVGNGSGLTLDELETMMEIWTCLQSLLSHFDGQEDDAERVGVFDNWKPEAGISREHHLKEWTAYLMTLGPQVVLSLAAGSFDRAKMLRLATWPLPPPGDTRSMFLTSATSFAYQEAILAEATAKAAQITLPRMASARHRSSRSADFSSSIQKSLRLDTNSIRERRALSLYDPLAALTTEIRPDCDPDGGMVRFSPAPVLFPSSPTNDPTIFHTLSMTTTASTKLGATLFPVDYTTWTPRVSLPPAPTRAPPPIPGQTDSVIDPIDRHMELLVNTLGFNEHKAKRALAMCDTGSGIDVHQAIELLLIESKRDASPITPVELPAPIHTSTLPRPPRQRRDTCSGDCSRNSTLSIRTRTPSATHSTVGSIYSKHTRSRSQPVEIERDARSRSESQNQSQPNRPEVPISPVTDIYGGHSDESDAVSDVASEIRREELDVVSPLKPAPIMANVRRMGTPKAWKILGASQQNPRSQKPAGRSSLRRSVSGTGGVVGIEEYARRVERRRSQRLVVQATRESVDGSNAIKVGLESNLNGLGLGSLGGLGGLREVKILEPEVKSKRWKSVK